MTLLKRTVLLPAKVQSVKHGPVMNGLERKYADRLDAMQATGLIAHYWFQGFTLLLAADCRFTPDFVVQFPDGSLEIHETKGFFRDDAKVKLKVCARQFPFPIKLVTHTKATGFVITEIAP